MPNTSSLPALSRTASLTGAIFAQAAKGVNRGTRLGNSVAYLPGSPADWPAIRSDMMHLAGLGVPSIAMLFDSDTDAAGPSSLAVQINIEPTKSVLITDCAFWMADSDDTLLIVQPRCLPDGHFALASKSLTYRAGWPAADLEPGIDRARRQLAQLSDELAIAVAKRTDS